MTVPMTMVIRGITANCKWRKKRRIMFSHPRAYNPRRAMVDM